MKFVFDGDSGDWFVVQKSIYVFKRVLPRIGLVPLSMVSLQTTKKFYLVALQFGGRKSVSRDALCLCQKRE